MSYRTPIVRNDVPAALVLYWRRVKAETTAPVGRHQRFKTSQRASAFRDRFFPEATAADWNDWRWQLRNRIRDLDGLVRVLRVSDDERAAILRHTGSLPVGISPYYASLLDSVNASQPLRRTVVMVTDEYLTTPGEADDPLDEDRDSPVPASSTVIPIACCCL
jgi:lysine 2,3-aminomutase